MSGKPFNGFLPEWRGAFKATIEAKGFSARKLSLRAGLGATTVTEWLNPKKEKTPSLESFAAACSVLEVKIDKFLQPNSRSEVAVDHVVPVNVGHAELIGELNAGHWVEEGVYRVEEFRSVPLVPHPDYVGIKQFAWRVMGESMNRVAKPDTYVIGVSVYDMAGRRGIRSGDVVVCERQDGALHEYTLKRVEKVENGWRLDPDSDDERWQEPVWVSDDLHSEEETVRITHLIIGQFGFLA